MPSSNSSDKPASIKKRSAIKVEMSDSEANAESSPTSSPSKKAKTMKSTSNYHIKGDAWTPQDRLQLFEAYQSCAQIKWDDVAAKMGSKSATQCRKQWQRATGNILKKALHDSKE